MSLSRRSFLGRSALAVAALAGVRLPAAAATPADVRYVGVPALRNHWRAWSTRFRVLNHSRAPIKVELRDSQDRHLVAGVVAAGSRLEQSLPVGMRAERLLIDGRTLLAVRPGLTDMDGCRGYHLEKNGSNVSAWMGSTLLT